MDRYHLDTHIYFPWRGHRFLHAHTPEPTQPDAAFLFFQDLDLFFAVSTARRTACFALQPNSSQPRSDLCAAPQLASYFSVFLSFFLSSHLHHTALWGRQQDFPCTIYPFPDPYVQTFLKRLRFQHLVDVCAGFAPTYCIVFLFKHDRTAGLRNSLELLRAYIATCCPHPTYMHTCTLYTNMASRVHGNLCPFQIYRSLSFWAKGIEDTAYFTDIILTCIHPP